ncbi:hypothetical protein Aca07nite_88100 [Actinoplanes capillaceus]|uniref:Uncharacterized protein n=1 Tax=Actinoplanes campanulatus TaxID=113559 RepID=A0ABQ3WZ21_9ACTN|nr:hypothetical protein Aca07nite_88100 [Actinoplanes capillaceus]
MEASVISENSSRSVYSPAAYLAELLKLAGPGPDLTGRRPDLAGRRRGRRPGDDLADR